MLPQLTNLRVEDGIKHVVILGAGPAGLTAAYELTHHAIPVTVLEKDSRYVGGIARTVEYQGNRIDIGGHRFFSKSREIEALWTEILGDEMLVRRRLSHVFFRGHYFTYPLDVSDLLMKLGSVEILRCIISYIWAHIHPIENPQTYEDWVVNEFGERLFQILFKPYTEKVWGMSTKISADWAPQRIRRLNLKRAMISVLPFVQRVDGRLTKTLVDHFRYHRLGPGQMWERLRAILEERGQRVMLGQEVISLQHDGTRISSVLVQNEQGAVQEIQGTHFISTLPIRELVEMCNPPLPLTVQKAAKGLKYRDFLTVALLIDKEKMFPDNWIYLPDPKVRAGRIQNFKNWSPAMVADSEKTCLGLEYFCLREDALWMMPDEDLLALAQRELIALGMCQREEILGGIAVRQPKAYPVYDEMYREHVAVVRKYVEEQLVNLQLVGRNGMHHYDNQDHAMMTALLAARNIARGLKLDPWKVNTDGEYHEEVQLKDKQFSDQLVPQRVERAKLYFRQESW